MRQIVLSKGFHATVDDEDYAFLSMFKWHYSKGYAVKNVRLPKGRIIHVYMHRVVVGAKKGEFCDHINRQTIDNRRANLRIATRSQNGANRAKQKNNSTGFKGVIHNRKPNTWTAHIRINGKKLELGTFKTPELASMAYLEKAREVFGDFASA